MYFFKPLFNMTPLSSTVSIQKIVSIPAYFFQDIQVQWWNAIFSLPTKVLQSHLHEWSVSYALSNVQLAGASMAWSRCFVCTLYSCLAHVLPVAWLCHMCVCWLLVGPLNCWPGCQARRQAEAFICGSAIVFHAPRWAGLPKHKGTDSISLTQYWYHYSVQ